MELSQVEVIFEKREALNEREFEVVERKGLGHPDTLCDFIAEEISKEYSQYCLKELGIILTHMVDKIGLIGGLSDCDFGGGKIVKPITLVLTGRLSERFGETVIPAEKIAIEAAKKAIKLRLPLLNLETDLVIQNNLHGSRGPGVVKGMEEGNERSRFYQPKQFSDVMYNNPIIKSNDTSATVGYYPNSDAENIALELEKLLNSGDFTETHPYVGSDIKVMVVKKASKVSVTCCIPFISRYTPSLEFYVEKKIYLKELLLKNLSEKYSKYDFEMYINTRDDLTKPDVYLTITGSAIESGDEGLVGRGNRFNGVINFTRPMSMEAYFGKNPVHHIGKVYTYIANKAAREIFEKYKIESEVTLVSQMGRPIQNPWSAFIKLNGAYSEEIKNYSINVLANLLKDTKITTHEIVSLQQYAGC